MNINICTLRIRELERKVDEETAELQQKDNTLKSLQENKQELEHIIKAEKERKHELDQIIQENYVTTISNCPESNNNSPENLGRSVFDVLLREKEEELTDLNGKIQIIMRMFKTQFPQDCNLTIAVGNLDDTEEEESSPSPSECLTHLMECVDRLSSDFEEEKFKVECLSTQVKSKQRHNEELGEKLLDFEKEVVLLRDQIKQMEKLNFELEQSKKSTHEKVEDLNDEHISHSEMEITKLKDQLENRDNEIVTLRLTNEKLLNEEKVLHQNMKVICAEMLQVQSKNVELQRGIDMLKTDFQREKHNSYLAISKLDEHILQMADGHANLEDTLRELVTDSERTKAELFESKAAFNAVMATAGSLSKMLFGDQPVDLLSRLPDIVANVKILQEEQRDIEKKSQLHSSTNLDVTSHSQEIEKELQTFKKTKEDVELNLKRQLEESESKINFLRNQLKLNEDTAKKMQKQLTEEMEALLRFKSDEHAKHVMEMRVQHEHSLKTMEDALQLAKDQIEKKKLTDEHTKYINEIKVEHGNALRKLETDLRLAEALIKKKDCELLTATRAQSEVRRNLNEGMNRLELIGRSYREIKTKSMVKSQQLEKRIEELLVENNQVHEEIDTLKRAYEVVNENFGEAAAAIKYLSLELLHEVENKGKVNAQLIETEQKLKVLLKDQSDIIKCKTEELTSLKMLSDNQTKTWQKILTETIKERDRLVEKSTTYKLQFQQEQEGKSALLSSLEQAVLKMEQFEKECAELQSKLKASNERCTELESVINNRDEQLQKIVTVQKLERDNSLLDLNRFLAEQALEKESYNIELDHLTSFLEDHMNLCADANHNEFPLEVPKNECDTNLGILKISLNSFISNVAYLQTEANAKVEMKKLEMFEAKLRAEEESNVLKQSLKVLESKVEEVILENLKFTHTQEANTKRFERLALRLYLTQVRLCRSEQENHRLLEALKINKSLVEKLSKDKISDELSEETELRKLLEGNAELYEKNEKLEASESDLKCKLNKSEQIRKSKEESIRKISSSLRISEKTIVRLNQEIGGANLQLSEFKRLHNQQVEEKSYLKERLKSAEDLIAHLDNKLHGLEKSNTSLTEEKKMVEASEWNVRLKIKKMEKERKSNEEKIPDLNYSFEIMESKNVSLFHEIGAANSQLCEMKELRDNALARAAEFEKKAEECLADAENLHNQNTKLSGQLIKVSSDLQTLQKENDFLSTESGNLQVEFVALKEQNEQLEKEHNITIAKLMDSEIKNERLLNENEEKQAIFDTKVEQFKCEFSEKLEQISMLRTEQESLWEQTEAQNLHNENLKQRLLAAETKAESEERNTSQLILDCQTLQEKYEKIKNRLIGWKKVSEEALEKIRLEMEKMKNQMNITNSQSSCIQVSYENQNVLINENAKRFKVF